MTFIVVSKKVALLVEALWMLLKADVLARAGYAVLSRQMNAAIARTGQGTDGGVDIQALVAAVRRACRYYPRSPACLQRSIALTSMLRKRGVAAHLQIGVRHSPFQSHAWVEVAGRVINDDQQVREIYKPLHEFRATPR
jgi:hypothetical protein